MGIPVQSLTYKRGIVPVCALVVLLGATFRLINLDQKPYWMDEGYTLLRASGYTAAEARQQLFGGRVITVAEFRKYQSPSIEKGASGTITGLATEEPQHPPLYFLLTRFWEQLFGTSKTAVRSLSVIFSLLALPAIYWLCLELFAVPAVGWLAMALYAASPICLQHAQSARQYSLWLLLMLVASATLLRALKQPKRQNRTVYTGVYIVTIALGLYTHLLTGLIVIAHGIYLFAIEKFRLTISIRQYLISAAISIAIAFPWLQIVWKNRGVTERTTEWMNRPLSFSELTELWGQSINRGFVAWHFQYEHLLFYLVIPLILLIGYAFYYLCRHTAARTWAFVLILLGTSFLPFLFADLLVGGGRSTSDRYFLLCYVCIYLAIAYLLASKLALLRRTWQSQFWRLVTALILSIGVVSCANGALGKTWWGWSEFDVEIPPIVHQFSQPLVISDMSFYESFRFAHQFDPNVHLLLLDDPNSFKLPNGFQHVFLFAPSDQLLSITQQQSLHPKLVYQFTDNSTQFTLSLYQIEL
jgi:uncharacterized membrane protein